MARLTRKRQLILGNTSSLNEITQFATPRGTPSYTKDVATVQGIGTQDAGTRWEEGWFNETQDGNYRPYAEDRNAVDYVVTSQLAYILQAGIAEWETGTDYHTGSIVRYDTANETKLYRSKVNNNTGNNPTTTGTTYWEEFTLGEDDAGMVGEVRMFAGANLPSNKWMFCRGQELSKTDYASLYSAIGIAYGGTSEGTTFNIPNFQFRIPFGVGTTGNYSTLGYQFGTLDHAHGIPGHKHTALGGLEITGASGSHTHTVNDPGHRHRIEWKSGKNANTDTEAYYVSNYVNNLGRHGDSGHMCNVSKTDISLNASNHTHGAGSFGGWVGSASGANGDNTVTSQTSNPPCLCINFIIKVR